MAFQAVPAYFHLCSLRHCTYPRILYEILLKTSVSHFLADCSGRFCLILKMFLRCNVFSVYVFCPDNLIIKSLSIAWRKIIDFFWFAIKNVLSEPRIHSKVRRRKVRQTLPWLQNTTQCVRDKTNAVREFRHPCSNHENVGIMVWAKAQDTSQRRCSTKHTIKKQQRARMTYWVTGVDMFKARNWEWKYSLQQNVYCADFYCSLATTCTGQPSSTHILEPS